MPARMLPILILAGFIKEEATERLYNLSYSRERAIDYIPIVDDPVTEEKRFCNGLIGKEHMVIKWEIGSIPKPISYS